MKQFQHSAATRWVDWEEPPVLFIENHRLAEEIFHLIIVSVKKGALPSLPGIKQRFEDGENRRLI